MSLMRKLLLLPLTLPVAAARGALDAVLRTLLDAVMGTSPPPVGPTAEPPLDEAWPEEVPVAEPTPEPEEVPVAAPTPRLHDDEPTRGEVNRRREALREAEGGGPGGVAAEVRVVAPWEGYERMTVAQILDRLVGADEATRAVVRLYEAAHRNRAAVLRATEV